MTLGAGKRNTLCFALVERLLARQVLGLPASRTDPSLASRSYGLAGAGRRTSCEGRAVAAGRDKAGAGPGVGEAAVRLCWFWAGSGEPGSSWMKVPKARGAGLAQGLEASAGLDGAGGRDLSRPGPVGLPWGAAGGHAPDCLIRELCVKKRVFSLVGRAGGRFFYSFWSLPRTRCPP